MEHNNKINQLQLIALIQAGIVGISIIELPSVIIREAAADAWMSIIIGSGITLLFAFGAVKLSLYYPEDTFVEYIPKAYGKIFGYFINGLIILYFIIFISLSGRLFANAVRINLLPNTPQWAVLMIFWIAIGYWIKSGIKVIVLSVTIMFIPVLITFVILFILPVTEVKLENLLPVFADGIIPVLKGGYKVIPYYFGFASLSFIMPVVKDHDKVYRAVIIGILIPTAIFLLLIFLLITRFSVDEVQNMIYPVVTLIKSFKLPGAFIERLESLFFVVFIIIALDNMAIYLYLSVLSLVRWTNKPNYNIYIFIVIIMAFLFSILPLNFAYVVKGFNYLTYVGMFFVMFIVPLGILITFFKRRSNKS